MSRPRPFMKWFGTITCSEERSSTIHEASRRQDSSRRVNADHTGFGTLFFTGSGDRRRRKHRRRRLRPKLGTGGASGSGGASGTGGASGSGGQLTGGGGRTARVALAEVSDLWRVGEGWLNAPRHGRLRLRPSDAGLVPGIGGSNGLPSVEGGCGCEWRRIRVPTTRSACSGPSGCASLCDGVWPNWCRLGRASRNVTDRSSPASTPGARRGNSGWPVGPLRVQDAERLDGAEGATVAPPCVPLRARRTSPGLSRDVLLDPRPPPGSARMVGAEFTSHTGAV